MRTLLSCLVLLGASVAAVQAQPLRVSTNRLPDGRVAVPYAADLDAAGGRAPYQWSISSGSLPPGINLSQLGAILGLPTAAGSYDFAVAVQDRDGARAEKNFRIQIAALTVSVVTASPLPNATLGAAYSVQLEASGGFPPYTWTSMGNVPAGLTLSSAGVLSGTPTAPGASSVSVRVRDTFSTSDTRTFSLTVQSPAATITTTDLPQGTVGAPYSAMLAATGGTPPYAWSVASGSLPAGLVLASNGAISGTPTAAGTSTFTVQANDVTKALSITILPAALTITTTDLPQGTVGAPYSAMLAATGGTPPYAWSVASGSLPAGLVLASNGAISGTPTAAGSSTFTVQANDVTKALSVTILPTALTITTTDLPQGTVGAPYSATLAATGGTPPYAWSVASGSLPAGLVLASNGVISGTPAAAGTSAFTVQANDVTKALSITILPAALTITTTDLPQGTVGAPYSAMLAATGGTPPYAWSVASGSLPAGLVLASNGVISGTPAAAGTSAFTVQANDVTKALSITILPAALTITTTDLPQGTVGAPYSAMLAATGGTPPYAWSVASGSLPAGLMLASNGAISGTPTTAGTSTFTVQANDVTKALSITILPAALTITTADLPQGTVGAPYSAMLAATGGTPPYAWSVASGTLPAGLMLASNGAISGTPTTAGTANFTVRVNDVTKALSITIGPAGLAITTSDLPQGTVGTAYSATLTATGGTPPYAWSVASGNLPTGLTLASNGTISGTPTAVGTSNFAVRVNDVTKALSITIVPAALTITTTDLPPGAVGAAYSATLTATGGTPPYAWSVASGNLPAGLTLASNGAISGTPTTAGTSNFTVRVNDVTKALSITIAPAGLAITTNDLPQGTVGAAYSATLTATGGTPPYAWSVASGNLPAGLTLASNGAISGTPTTAGTSNFTVRVNDVTKALSITIAPSALTITTTNLLQGMVGSPYSATLTATGGTPPYAWSVASGNLPAGLTLASNGAISGTPTTAGTSTFTARVNNVTKSLSITVAPPTLTVTTTELPAGTLGVAYSATVSANGGVTPYTWAVSSGTLPAGLSLAANGRIAGTPTAAGTSSVGLRVTDSTGKQVVRSLSIVIRPGDPVITSSALPEGKAGTPYSATLTATGGVAPYSWSLAQGSLPAGLTLATSGAITGSTTAPGSTPITVRVTDAAGSAATRELTLTIRPSDLAISTSTLNSARAGTPYAAQLAASGGQPPYVFAVNSGSLPEGISLAASGALSGTPTMPGSYSLAVRVSDNAGLSTSRTLALVVAAALSIETPAQLASGSLGAPYSQTLEAKNGTAPYLWAVVAGDLPPGVQLSPAGVFSGIPSIAGEYNFSVRVADAAGGAALRQFTISIANGLVIATAPSLRGGIVRTPYSETLQASGGRPPYIWSITEGGLPDGIRLDPSTGLLAGTPTATGTFAFTVAVADSASARATKRFTLVVAAALAITSAPTMPATTAGAAYSTELRANGGRPPYVWSIAAGGLPPGLSLSPDTGIISGNATAAGAYRFTVRVTDSASATATLEATLAVAAALEITTAPTLTASLGAPFQTTLAATGGAAPYAWSVASGALPPGVTLSGAGVLSGTPSAAGTFRFTVRVSDARSTQGTKDFTLEVGSGLTITTAPLPAAIVGTPYTATFAATGGTAPYAWSIDSGALPGGVTLNATTGELSGTPNAGGTFNFGVKVTDAAGQTSTRTYTVTATLPDAPPLRITGIPAVASPADQAVFELQLDAAYPVEISGILNLDFEPDAANNADDPAVQFTTGGRSVSFRFPAGSTKAIFPDPQIAVQTGTVAGSIRLRASISAGGRNLANGDIALQSATVARTAPVIRTARLVREGQTLTVEIAGYSTSRELRSVTLRFQAATGATLGSTEFTVSIQELAAGWYSSPASARFGSLFTLRLPFTIQGAADAVGSVTAVLSNAQGESAAATASQQ